MADDLRIQAISQNGITEVKALIRHPMETGSRRDRKGKFISADFIKEVTLTHNSKVVMQAYWGPSISANPYLDMQFYGGVAGDTVTVSWVDSTGATGSGMTKIREVMK